MSSPDLYALMRGRPRGVSGGAVHAVPFLASLALPPRAFAVGAGVIAFVGVLALAAKWASIPPIDVSWLFYANFAIVYGLQVAPVLIYGAFALKRLGRSPHHPPAVRFLCLVPAYNEEAVIRNSVGTLMQQAYPKHLYEVYVVSDGGGDRTEEITEALGARVFRTGTGGIGKHRALGVAFAQLLTGEDDERYVCVIDADNRVAANYLQEMNNAICERGDRCLQSFHDVLNGSDNWITKSHWLNGVASSQLYNPGRFQSLGTALICGTGWCCQAGLLKKYWPLIRTQTEDIELTGLLLLHEGLGVSWIPGTHVYDEKPLNLWVAIRQRHRWMTGHMRVAGNLFWPLVREGIRRRDPRFLELALYYLLPFVMNLGNLQLFLLLGIDLGILAVQGPFGGLALPWAVNGLTLFYIFGYQVVGFGRETGLWARALPYSFYAAIFSFLAWTPALIWACFTVSRQDWIFHTPHIAGMEPGVSTTRARAG
jgi:cellulose synthase/poly-beta-1,6-N-acetylglucosamine synthase-like glycosyltransferase